MWNRKKEFTIEEQELITLVDNLANDADTRVNYDLDNADYIMQNEVLHYNCIIDGTGVLLSNSVFTLRKSWRADVLDTCKTFAKNRIKIENETARIRIISSESEMFNKMLVELENKL